ncbi:SagB/ThcOx family dehydrogenase [Lactobacillus helveticus]|nr:SagB/ThcOx family dehydrogenase [Lactobacillus helveticus]MCT3409498.1 SagB/ThcOx family dehydrogenase [Lactobacillus helveticus]PXZ19772.1 hypothetical protein DM475_04150 [Lactobacillus helveticus]
MKYNDIYNYGNKIKKISFNRIVSLDSGEKEHYYNRFITNTDSLKLDLDNDFNSSKYAKSFGMYGDAINKEFSTSFKLHEELRGAIFLPPVEKKNSYNLETLFNSRISKRKFTNANWNLQNLSNLFSGIRVSSDGHRGYASGGGLYPVSLYFFTQGIMKLDDFSVYKYQPCTNSVIKIENMPNKNLSSYVHIENLSHSENIKLAIYLVVNRTKNEFKYGKRGLIFSMIESGEMIQNIALSAAQYDYKMCQLGGYDIEKSNIALGIDGFASFITACAVLGG